ncbi:MAG TPA: biopolymer transporter ExbD [Opitutales bacterium]|jgi:biopolymer transport protein ExbD|nr:biopolymer transporter ExbD [Opitutales bacterium]
MALYARRRRPSPTVNIVPLVDVLVVLIFFFLMVMQFDDTPSLDITPPKMDTAGTADAGQRFIVSIDKTGKYFINQTPVTPEQLTTQLKEAADKQGASLNILIYADQDTPLKDVTFVMDAGRKLKLDKIRLQTR